MQQVDSGLKKALVTFASARALNGAISVLQGTLIDASPGGVGLTLAPGQLLEPVNELVRHFSDLMLVASVAFGIQKILISISAYWVNSLILTGVAIGWAVIFFRQRLPPSWLSKLLIVLLMLRFAIPMVTLGSDLISQKFMNAEYIESQKIISNTTDQVDEKPPAGVGKWWMPAMPKLPDIDGKLAQLKSAAEHMVKLMVIFLLQTLIIPVILLWGLYAVVKTLFEGARVQSQN